MRNVLAIALLALGVQGCTTTRALAPLQKGQHGMSVSLGGPFVQFAGAPIPVPFTQIGYRYGLDGHGDVHAGLYATGLFTTKVGGFDLGVSRELVTADGGRPRIMLDMNHGFFFGDSQGTADPTSGPGAELTGAAPGGFRWFPELQAVFTWDLGTAPHRVYVGVDGFFQVVPEAHALVTPFFGTELRASRTLGVVLEVGWISPWTNTTAMNPVWYGPGDQGVVSAKLGFNIYLGQRLRDAHLTRHRAAPAPTLVAGEAR